MPRPTLESRRIYDDLAQAARTLAARSGWRTSEIYIVLVDWVRPRARKPICTLDEAMRALDVVLGCAKTLAEEALGGNVLCRCHRAADFQETLRMIQDLAENEHSRRIPR